MKDNKKRKWKKITDEGVLILLKSGKYRVDTNTGTVYNRKGRPLKPFSHISSKSKHLFIYLFYNGDSRRGISLGKLVWMAATESTVPEGWEVHHEDGDPTNNKFSNLFCLHPLDHRKVHHWTPSPEEEIPF